MRQLIGVGTPRGLQGRLSAVVAALLALIRSLLAARYSVMGGSCDTSHGSTRRSIARSAVLHVGVRELVFTTGC